jgi:hypothetical protein
VLPTGWCWLALILTGCNREGASLYGLSGTVRFRDAPLAHGNILLESVDPANPGQSGATISEGAFTIPKNRGLKPGTYIVRIHSADLVFKDENQAPGESNRLAKERIPSHWNAESKETIEVRADDKNEFDFDIK